MTTRAVISSVYAGILSHFPNTFRLAFAYGSGVFQQQGHEDTKKNMLDFIFVVDDPISWHKANIAVNPKHYSFLRYFGAAYVNRIQNVYGAGVYFNTLVPCEDRLIKYGVISTRRLITDLLDWDTLYVSGRLHKPVLMLRTPDSGELNSALQTNLQNALHTVLLQLPDTFTEKELYTSITALSYSGDFRMSIGEDKNKVENIVTPNIDKFRELFRPSILKEKHLHWNQPQGIFEQCNSSSSKYHHLNLLPKMLLINLVAHMNMDGRNRDTEELVRILAHSPDCDEFVQKCVAQIVKSSSISQSMKGIFTAGFRKSIIYSNNKLKKMIKSQRKSITNTM